MHAASNHHTKQAQHGLRQGPGSPGPELHELAPNLTEYQPFGKLFAFTESVVFDRPFSSISFAFESIIFSNMFSSAEFSLLLV